MNYSKKAQDAMKIAMKSEGKQDTKIYNALNGEEWEVNVDEYAYLTSSETGTQKEREGVIMEVGSGDINPDTGRRRFFVITGTVLAIAAGVGAVAKGISGWNKRRKQRNLLKEQKSQTNEAMKKAREDTKKAYEDQVSAQARDREQTRRDSNQAFDNFAVEASNSIKNSNDMVVNQKGLNTGIVDKNNQVMTDNITQAASYKDLAQKAGLKQMDIESKKNFQTITRSSEDVLAALKANKTNIQTAIDGTKGIGNYIEDGLSGASTAIGFLPGLGGTPS